MISRRTFQIGSLALGASALPVFGKALSMASPEGPNFGKVLGTGPTGWCDDYAVGGGVVRWSEQHGRWLMWYYARDAQFAKDMAPTLGTGRIALAMSDDGVTWERHEGPGYGGSILEPSSNLDDFDSGHIGVLDVTQVDDKWYLWYLGGDHQAVQTPSGAGPKGYRMRSGLAVSTDGENFEKLRGAAPGGAALDFMGYTFTTWPNGVHDGEQFVLYYTTVNAPTMQFGTEVATSPDGVNWAVQGPITWTAPPTEHEVKGIMTRHVMENPLQGGQRWLMLYTALDGSDAMVRSIFAAQSDDGLEWERLYDDPIFTAGSAGNWDDGGVAVPQLTKADDELLLYYFGFPTPDNPNDVAKGIGLATSPSGDLRDFTRVRAAV